MKKFLIRCMLFIFCITLIGEIMVRYLRLVPDIPQLFVDKTGIQRYNPGQSGYYTKATSKWQVNKYGWLGVADTQKDTVISIIGDSYIENIMNPISCNQASKLKLYFQNYSFFEAGRSGVTAIEALQIVKLLDSTIHPKLNLVYVSDDDFKESISNINKYSDRIQLDLNSNKISYSELKSPFLKKILYNFKVLYYLYLRWSSMNEVIKHEKLAPTNIINAKNDLLKNIDTSSYKKLLVYFKTHQNNNKIVFIFHPGADKRIIDLVEEEGFKAIELGSVDDADRWALNKNDGHWSCYGHSEVAKRIKKQLPKIIDDLLVKK